MFLVMTFEEFEQIVKAKFSNQNCIQINDSSLGEIYVTSDYQIGYIPYDKEWWVIKVIKSYSGKTLEEALKKKNTEE